VITELIQMTKDFQVALKRETVLGLWQDEIVFFDALANNESAVRELDDDILKKSPSRSRKSQGPAQRWFGKCARACVQDYASWYGAVSRSGSIRLTRR
jgi:hypothetical protein